MHTPFWLSWIVLLSSAIPIRAQQYPFVRAPGSPNETGSLFEDSRGRLWVGDAGGLLCFDGSIFYPLPGLITRGDALNEDGLGGIWIASGEALYRYYQGRSEYIGKGRPIGAVTLDAATELVSMASAPDVDAWLTRVQHRHGSWTLERIVNLHSRGTFATDSRGMLTYRCRDAWCEIRLEDLKHWHQGLALRVIRHPTSTRNTFGANKVIRDRFGCVWLRTEIDAQYQCPDDPTFKSLPYEIASENGNADISEADDGSIVITSNTSLAIGRPEHFAIASAANGLPNAVHSKKLKDGTVWISGTQGLYRMSYPFRMEYWNARDGLEAPDSIMRAYNRIFSASGRGISVLSRDKKAWLPLSRSLEFGPTWHLLKIKAGDLLAAGPNGMAQVAADGTIVARSPPGTGTWGAHLAQSSDGKIWLSGLGVSQVTRKGKVFVKHPEDVLAPRQNGLDIEFSEKAGKLAACYAGGLTSLRDGKWVNVSKKNGLLEDACRSMTVTANGDVWYAYSLVNAFALIRQNPTDPITIRQFYGNEEIGPPSSLFFDVDSRDWLWRGAPDGVHVAYSATAEAGRWLHLDGVDGLPALYMNQGAFYSDSDGSVWWGAENTITHFNPPQDFVDPKAAPQVSISGYSWNGSTPKLSDQIYSLPSGLNITAHVGSLQFDRRNALRLRYRLLPAQQTWQDSRSLDLPLGKLAWGTHTLELQARLFTGPWSATQRHAFSVPRPIWLAWPVLLSFGGSAFAGGAIAYRWRRKRKQRTRQAFPDLAELRLAALSPEAHDLAGTVLDSRFAVGNLVARGGFAAVFKGFDSGSGNAPCAIKVFRQELVDKAWISRRFQQEVAALEQIHHANVVRILGSGITPGGAPYLAMEFIEGETLRAILQSGALNRAQTGSYLRQIGSALQQIHAREICHRDLKPENLMIRANASSGAELVLIDFSIAIVKEPDETIHGLSRAAGTLHYMAPEQSIGFASAASDIYSLAKIVIEMLTGLKLNLLLPNASMDLPLRVNELLVDSGFRLSAESIQLLGSALEFDPAHRPQIAREFAERIARDLQNDSD